MGFGLGSIFKGGIGFLTGGPAGAAAAVAGDLFARGNGTAERYRGLWDQNLGRVNDIAGAYDQVGRPILSGLPNRLRDLDSAYGDYANRERRYLTGPSSEEYARSVNRRRGNLGRNFQAGQAGLDAALRARGLLTPGKSSVASGATSALYGDYLTAASGAENDALDYWDQRGDQAAGNILNASRNRLSVDEALARGLTGDAARLYSGNAGEYARGADRAAQETAAYNQSLFGGLGQMVNASQILGAMKGQGGDTGGSTLPDMPVDPVTGTPLPYGPATPTKPGVDVPWNAGEGGDQTDYVPPRLPPPSTNLDTSGIGGNGYPSLDTSRPGGLPPLPGLAPGAQGPSLDTSGARGGLAMSSYRSPYAGGNIDEYRGLYPQRDMMYRWEDDPYVQAMNEREIGRQLDQWRGGGGRSGGGNTGGAVGRLRDILRRLG